MFPIDLGLVLTPTVLVAALVYDVLLIAAAVLLYRRWRDRPRRGSGARLVPASSAPGAGG